MENTSNKNEKLPLFISLGMLLGITGGVIVGIWQHDFAVGLSLGVGLGIAVGAIAFLLYSTRDRRA